MHKSTIYHVLIVLMLSLLPLSGVAQQNTDINKPTRSRVNDKTSKKTDDKKTADNKKAADNKKNTQKNTNNKQQEAQSTAKSADKSAAAKNNDKNNDKKNVTPATKAVEATVKDGANNPKKTDNNNSPKPGDNKTDNAAASKDGSKPVADTVNKPAAPPKPKKVPVDADKVQYDGIDVSKHQGVIDWEELRKYSKIQFVYIKATEGSNYVDPRYRQNINNARKQGFKVGSYHYFTDLSSATAQFKNFINIAKREEQDLIPVIDVEKRDKWTSQQLRDSVKVFADLLEDYYGCKPIIYTFETFFTKNLGKAFEKYPIFIAKYPKGQEQPNINGIKWILWQFSECGKFRGVKDNLVDMSRFNKGYSINDIAYNPGKHKPKNSSVRDAVDHKDKPATVNMTEQKPKEAPKQSKKQQEEAKKQAEKDKKTKERNKKLAEDEAKKKADADKKAAEKAKAQADQQKREKARQQAREAEAKKEAEARAKKEAEAKAKAKQEADAKAKRKADAQKAREQKTNQKSSGKSNKPASLLNTSASKLSQSQRNDSIRTAKQKGRKTNKSSADND